MSGLSQGDWTSLTEGDSAQTDTPFRACCWVQRGGDRQASEVEAAVAQLCLLTLRASRLLSASCPVSLAHRLTTQPTFSRPDLLQSQSDASLIALAGPPTKPAPGSRRLQLVRPRLWCQRLQATAACRHGQPGLVSEQDTREATVSATRTAQHQNSREPVTPGPLSSAAVWPWCLDLADPRFLISEVAFSLETRADWREYI